MRVIRRSVRAGLLVKLATQRLNVLVERLDCRANLGRVVGLFRLAQRVNVFLRLLLGVFRQLVAVVADELLGS